MSKMPQEATCLQMFHDLDSLRIDLDPRSPHSGLEAHDRLFADAGPHARLLALADRREEFKATLTGEVRQIDNFAVTSGHEALAMYADRIASFAGVRTSSIPRQREELDAARARQDAVAIAKHEHSLNLLGEEFAKCILSAFKGWEEHRAWIQRSIEQEQGNMTKPPAASGPALRTRSADAVTGSAGLARPFDVDRARERLSKIASEFDDCVRILRSQPENPVLVSQIQSLLAEAGYLLCRLLHDGCIERPRQLPTLLRWRTRSAGPRPLFGGYRGSFHGTWPPRKTVLGLMRVLAGEQQAIDTMAAHTMSATSAASVYRRLVFAEAVTGWLGQRHQPKVTTSLPTYSGVIFRPETDPLGRPDDEETLEFVVDWNRAPALELTHRFLELGRAAAAVCRHLASSIARPAAAEPLPRAESQGHGRIGETRQGQRPASRSGRPPSSRERDVAALAKALEWDKAGKDWTLKQLLSELGCERTQLTGKKDQSSYRCPTFMRYWKQKSAEKRQRAVNLRKTNRTRVNDDSSDEQP